MSQFKYGKSYEVYRNQTLREGIQCWKGQTVQSLLRPFVFELTTKSFTTSMAVEKIIQKLLLIVESESYAKRYQDSTIIEKTNAV